MAEIDTERLIWIVTGVQLTAELGDRPLAYRLEQEVKSRLRERLGAPAEGEPPVLAPVVISDVYYLNNEEIQHRPTISIGGPGVNALSALLTDKLPTVAAIEDTLIVQMDLDMQDPRCAVWGMNHLDTVRAVDVFVDKKYLDAFIEGLVNTLDETEEG